MKKLVAVLLAVVLAASVCVGALAEIELPKHGYEIGHGLYFGMSGEEAMESLTQQGIEYELVFSGEELYWLRIVISDESWYGLNTDYVSLTFKDTKLATLELRFFDKNKTYGQYMEDFLALKPVLDELYLDDSLYIYSNDYGTYAESYKKYYDSYGVEIYQLLTEMPEKDVFYDVRWIVFKYDPDRYNAEAVAAIEKMEAAMAAATILGTGEYDCPTHVAPGEYIAKPKDKASIKQIRDKVIYVDDTLDGSQNQSVERLVIKNGDTLIIGGGEMYLLPKN